MVIFAIRICFYDYENNVLLHNSEYSVTKRGKNSKITFQKFRKWFYTYGNVSIIMPQTMRYLLMLLHNNFAILFDPENLQFENFVERKTKIFYVLHVSNVLKNVNQESLGNSSVSPVPTTHVSCTPAPTRVLSTCIYCACILLTYTYCTCVHPRIYCACVISTYTYCTCRLPTRTYSACALRILTNTIL